MYLHESFHGRISEWVDDAIIIISVYEPFISGANTVDSNAASILLSSLSFCLILQFMNVQFGT
jgi:hypothetical protein